MHKKTQSTLKILQISLILLSMFFMHISPVIYAQTTETSSVETVQETKPPSYVYNEQTGLWENGIYAWDPLTGKTTPLSELTYSYNPETENWDTNNWLYNPESQTYTENTTAQDVQQTEETQLIQPHSDIATVTEQPNVTNSNGSENEIDSDNSFYFENFYNAKISTNIQSAATSGDAIVYGNTLAGSALSGDASAYTKIINMLQSSWSANGQLPVAYNTTLSGDYIGDITVDPGMLKVSDNQLPETNLQVKNVESAAIINNVDLVSTSGSATVGNNTSAGDAVTGDAFALAQIMNLINSSISAQQSFIGTVNIYGDFEGDILLPESLTKQLLDANIPTVNINLSGDVVVDNETNIVVDNNLNIKAESGVAEVSKNTSAGSASSGNAQTEVTVFNLIGEQINSASGLLVFVNVLGEWIGFITGAPNSNTAFLGAASSSPLTSDSEINIESKRDYLVQNNLNLLAATGDAAVSNNTSAGDAKTGDAYASASVLNIINANLNFTSWFGALFINIFGDWNGSFGTDTAFGGYSTAKNNNGAYSGSYMENNNVTNSNLAGSTVDMLVYRVEGDPSNYKISPATVFSTSSNSTPPGIIGASNVESEFEPDDTKKSVTNKGSVNSTINLPFVQIVVLSITSLLLWKIIFSNRKTAV